MNEASIDSFTGEYRWLSNFWPARVALDGEWHRSVEHAYQAAKTLDLQDRRLIQDAHTPGLAKRLGRSVTLRPDWEHLKVSIMRHLLQQKFNNDPTLGDKLLATGHRRIIEANHWGDAFWGVYRGVGRNELGHLLMKVRSWLRSPTRSWPSEPVQNIPWVKHKGE